MPRPRKNNADYFTHDNNMRNDPKIRAIRKSHGMTGYAVWCMLLEVLTGENEFEYKVDEVSMEIMAGDFDIEIDDLNAVIESFSRLKLIQYEDGVIRCHNLTERMQPLIDKRARKREWAEQNKPSETDSDEVLDVQNPQSKGKKRKVNKSKGKDIVLQKTVEIIKYLNELCGTSYKSTTKGTNSMVNARLRDGYTVDDFKLVIKHKADAWLNDGKMRNYLRPETLFCEKHFEGYLNAAKVAENNPSPGAGPSNNGNSNGRATLNHVGRDEDYGAPQNF